jgi:hypothetical protein
MSCRLEALKRHYAPDIEATAGELQVCLNWSRWLVGLLAWMIFTKFFWVFYTPTCIFNGLLKIDNVVRTQEASCGTDEVVPVLKRARTACLDFETITSALNSVKNSQKNSVLQQRASLFDEVKSDLSPGEFIYFCCETYICFMQRKSKRICELKRVHCVVANWFHYAHLRRPYWQVRRYRPNRQAVLRVCANPCRRAIPAIRMVRTVLIDAL